MTKMDPSSRSTLPTAPKTMLASSLREEARGGAKVGPGPPLRGRPPQVGACQVERHPVDPRPKGSLGTEHGSSVDTLGSRPPAPAPQRWLDFRNTASVSPRAVGTRRDRRKRSHLLSLLDLSARVCRYRHTRTTAG